MNSETAFSADYWNGLWRERRRALAESGSRDCAHLWQDTEAARHYARQTADDGGGRRRIEIVLNDLAAPPGAKVLDIGSGPGPVTIPLARRASAVTAVEPAEGMRRVLEERIAAEGVTNITVAAKKWEEVLPEELDGPFDIVLSSFALGMEDLKGAVEKMTHLCRGRVFLYWFVGESSWQKTKRLLWPALHGRKIDPPPDTDLVYNLLFSLGYSVEVRRFSYAFTDTWPTLEDLVLRRKAAYNLTTPESEKLFIENMLPLLREDENGYWAPGYAEFAAYSWEASQGKKT